MYRYLELHLPPASHSYLRPFGYVFNILYQLIPFIQFDFNFSARSLSNTLKDPCTYSTNYNPYQKTKRFIPGPKPSEARVSVSASRSEFKHATPHQQQVHDSKPILRIEETRSTRNQYRINPPFQTPYPLEVSNHGRPSSTLNCIYNATRSNPSRSPGPSQRARSFTLRSEFDPSSESTN